MTASLNVNDVRERERARRIRLILTGAGAVFATAWFAWIVMLLGQSEPLSPAESRLASVQSAPPADSTVAAVSPAPASVRGQPLDLAPPPAAASENQPPPVAVQAERPTVPVPMTQAAAPVPSDPPDAQPAPVVAPAPPLSRSEIREVQKRLRDFGFNPGAIDGVAGHRTEVATQRYLEARGQPQLAPTDRDLLGQLRRDPARASVQTPASTQVAQRAAGTSFDPFRPVKAAGAGITRFFQSVFR